MNKRTVFIVLAGIVLLSAAAGLIFSYNVFSNSQLIAKNVYARGTYIGEMTLQEAQGKLEEKYNIQSLNLNCGESKFEIKSGDIGFQTDIDKTAAAAFEFGRQGIGSYIEMVFEKKKVLEISSSYDESKLDQVIAEISDKLSVSPSNASISITSGGIGVTRERDGISVKREQLKSEIVSILDYKTENNAVEVPVEVTKAQIRYEDIKGISAELGSYSTKYNVSSQSRSENLRVASNSVSGKILMPGQVFSMNETTGKRSVQNGYKAAPVIVKGKLEQGLGGGVCQVSSTLYNAVIRSGLQVVERRNHSIPSSYVGLGLDATVSYGSIDFKFKNNFSNPIYIQASSGGGYVNAKIYGYPQDKKNVLIQTQVVEKIQRQIENKYDNQLEEGKQVEEEKGRDGYKVKVYRLFKDSNGNIADKQTLSSDYYPAMKKIIVNGTKKVQADQAEQQASPADGENI